MQSLGTYHIKSKKANKYITIKDNSIKNSNKKCVLYEKSPLMIQTFQLNIKENNFIQFINPLTKELLTLSQGSDQNGAPFLCKSQDTEYQKSQYFQIHYTDKQANEVVIFTNSGKCLDCCEEATKNDTQIIQWDFHGSDNQTWILEKV